MTRPFAVVVPIALLLLSACGRPDAARGPSPEPPAGSGETAAPPPSAPSAPSAGAGAEAEVEKLETPFTAEEIRDEWIEGFTLEVRMSSPEGELLQRWTVVAADAEGVDIEYATLDAAGAVVGEPQVRRAAWTELRDHASFEAASATREEARRATSLGELDGWLYTVRDEAAGTVTEFFFARSLPGAPVEMAVTRDGEVLSTMSQVARRRPG